MTSPTKQRQMVQEKIINSPVCSAQPDIALALIIYSFKKYLPGTYSVQDLLQDVRENQIPLRP